MRSQSIHSPEELEHLINEMGFLPFFWNDVSKFSVGEFIAQEYWFPDEGDGVWEWKGPVIVEGSIAYGKFFNNKAGFISMDWFPDFLNYRRSKYHISVQERLVLQMLQKHQSLLSKELKRLCGYTTTRISHSHNPLIRQVDELVMHTAKRPKDKKESFETAITRLQMGCRVITADFEYNYDKEGKRYGWGVSRYCTPEDFFGQEYFTGLKRTPDESYLRIFGHLQTLLPHAAKKQIINIIG